jgi:hypothetical protein
MAGRFINPYSQFMDSTPDVYSGGKLYFYAAGTSTPLNTYTTKALAVANPNPIVLNSAGRPAVDIFLQDLEYKVVLTDANDVTIWTADPVSHRDSMLVAKTLTGTGTPNGAVAGTAGSSSVLPDFYWDYTNLILYVCTTTGTSSTAVWTAINASAATAAVPPPQGRLCPTSATPVVASDSTNNSVYYTPFVGNLIPVYNGTSMIPTTFSEISMALVASHAANTIYDIFVFSNNGVLTLASGPAWSTSTAGAGARGTGAGTTQLTRLQGLWVNAVSMTARNGSTTYTVGANLGTYVGSIAIGSGAGSISCLTAYGQSRRWDIWNAYNRQPTYLKAGDPADSTWIVNNASAIHAYNTSSANSITVFAGLPEETVKFELSGRASATLNTNQEMVVRIGIGFNSTTTISGKVANHTLTTETVSNAITTNVSLNGARFFSPPWIGINVATALEGTNGSDVNVTMYSGEDDMLLTAEYRS